MTLSKKRNRDRMREVRLHTRITIEPVQPKDLDYTIDLEDKPTDIDYVDADGAPVYND